MSCIGISPGNALSVPEQAGPTSSMDDNAYHTKADNAMMFYPQGLQETHEPGDHSVYLDSVKERYRYEYAQHGRHEHITERRIASRNWYNYPANIEDMSITGSNGPFYSSPSKSALTKPSTPEP